MNNTPPWEDDLPPVDAYEIGNPQNIQTDPDSPGDRTKETKKAASRRSSNNEKQPYAESVQFSTKNKNPGPMQGDPIEVLRRVIPLDMQDLPQWCCWGKISAGENQDKQPYSPHTGRIIKKNDDPDFVHNQCATFEEAALLVGQSEYEGVGFFATRHDPYMVLDLDSCADSSILDKLEPSNPEHLSRAAYKFVTSLPTYTERSMSLNGLHMIVKVDKIPDFFGQSKKFIIKDRAKNPLVELFYASDNYVALTGNSLFELPENADVVLNPHSVVSEYNSNDMSYAYEQVSSIIQGQSPARSIDQGGRDNYLFQYALQKMELGLAEDEVESLVYAENQNCNPPLTRIQVDKCIESARRRFTSPEYNQTNPPDYIRDYNELYFHINLRGKVVVMKEVNDPDYGLQLYAMTETDFVAENAEKKIRVPGKKQPVCTAKLWLEHPGRRRINRIVCEHDPTKVKHGDYNRYVGLKVDPKRDAITMDKAQDASCELFKNHLLEVVCDNDTAAYEYLIRWFARLVQEPTSPARTAVAMVGGKGTGKSLTARIIGDILGKSYVRAFSNYDRLTGQFNDYLECCCFLFLDEAFYAKSPKADGDLKAKVTEPTFMIEAKFQPIREIKNCLSILLATNNEHILPYSENERRYLTLNVSDCHIQERNYFDALVTQMYSEGGLERLAYELQTMDISDWRPEDIPATEGSKEQVLLSMDPLTAWWYTCLDRGWIIRPVNGVHPWNRFIVKSDLYSSYEEYCDELGSKYVDKKSSIAFSMVFNKKFLLPSELHDAKRGVKRKSKYFDTRLDEVTEKVGKGIQFINLLQSKDKFTGLYKEFKSDNWTNDDPNRRWGLDDNVTDINKGTPKEEELVPPKESLKF